MRIITKSCVLPRKFYIKLCLMKDLQRWWWIGLTIICTTAILSLVFHILWPMVVLLIGLVLFGLFEYGVFYSSSYVAENLFMFDRCTFEFTDNMVSLGFKTQQGKCITWNMVKECKKDDKKQIYILYVQRGQLMVIPFQIFKNKMDVELFELLLRKKKLV